MANCKAGKIDPVGSGVNWKMLIVVKACSSGTAKLPAFRAKRCKAGSPKTKGESEAYASRRRRFKTRHGPNIAKMKNVGCLLGNKVKWLVNGKW
jgi:hypothetical protein